jgi:hypothetical protein
LISELKRAAKAGAESVAVRVLEEGETDATCEVTSVLARRSTKTVILVGDLDQVCGEARVQPVRESDDDGPAPRWSSDESESESL